MIQKRKGIKEVEIDNNFLKRNPISDHKNDYGDAYGNPTFKDGEQGAKRIKITDHQAKALEGSYLGFQPKPAIEIIVVSMKGMTEKSYIDQAMKTGKGITWLDNCRIPYQKHDMPQGGYGRMGIGIGKPSEHQHYTPQKRGSLNSTTDSKWGYKDLVDCGSPKGRFPANLLVSDGVLDTGIESKTGWSNQDDKPATQSSIFAGIGGNNHYDDSGDFSRYFSLDAWFEEKMKELPKEHRRTFPFLIEPKPPPASETRVWQTCRIDTMWGFMATG